MRKLILANSYDAEYRILRCAVGRGIDVYVAGSPHAQPLQRSRYCKGFFPFSFEDGIPLDAMAATLDALARAHDIDLILPGGLDTTRLLAAMRSRLAAPCFPLPEIAAFDQLATKDRFKILCGRLDIPHPATTVFESRAGLCDALEKQQIRLPAMFKPIAHSGSVGVIRVDENNWRTVGPALDYEPILVQDFIEGEDRCITIFCRDGAVIRDVAYFHVDDMFRFPDEPRLSALVSRIAQDLRLTGVFNFDARIDKNGAVWMIECNPRFFYNMDVVKVAGVNFTRPDSMDQARLRSGRPIRAPRAFLRALARLQLPTAEDWRMLLHWLRDPAMFAWVVLHNRVAGSRTAHSAHTPEAAPKSAQSLPCAAE